MLSATQHTIQDLSHREEYLREKKELLGAAVVEQAPLSVRCAGEDLNDRVDPRLREVANKL